MKEVQAIVRALLAPDARPQVLATLVSVAGSSYRRPGARLLVADNGDRIGSISGGCLEEDVMARAKGVMASGIPETVVYDTTSENDLVWGVGLGCHGVVRVLLEKLSAQPAWAATLAANARERRPTRLAVRHSGGERASWGTRLAQDAGGEVEEGVFFQTIAPPTSLVIFGAGDDAMPLTRFAQELGWHITVADSRSALATAERFPQADALLVGPAAQLVAQVQPGSDALVVVMTHRYVHDVPLLRELLGRPLAYLGLLGPKRRAEKILSDLAGGGLAISAAMRARLHAPVGLDLGADSPEQVALAIVAEMQAVLTNRDARFLRERDRPIHG
jgi:xanthine dehydrogenase accessory factor